MCWLIFINLTQMESFGKRASQSEDGSIRLAYEHCHGGHFIDESLMWEGPSALIIPGQWSVLNRKASCGSHGESPLRFFLASSVPDSSFLALILAPISFPMGLKQENV